MRVAARYNATIVPVSAIGADESFEMLADADELLRVPFFGAKAAQTDARTPKAMPGERFVTPLSLPAPWRFRRFYFRLGAPIETASIDADDRTACADTYGRVRASVEEGIDYLLDRRAGDPFERPLPRLAFEAACNWTRRAPSFDV